MEPGTNSPVFQNGKQSDASSFDFEMIPFAVGASPLSLCFHFSHFSPVEKHMPFSLRGLSFSSVFEEGERERERAHWANHPQLSKTQTGGGNWLQINNNPPHTVITIHPARDTRTKGRPNHLPTRLESACSSAFMHNKYQSDSAM